MTLEQRVEDAIVARFFEPSWLMTSQPTYNNGMMTGSEVMPSQIPAPMTVVAEAIYAEAKDRILARVLDQLDIDAIVEEWGAHIAKDVVDKLQAVSPSWQATPSPSAREKMLTKVYDAVAEEFGRQCVEHLKNTGGLMAVLEA